MTPYMKEILQKLEEKQQMIYDSATIDVRFSEDSLKKESEFEIAFKKAKALRNLIDDSVHHFCDKCNQLCAYFTPVDASWCFNCNKWLEEKCGHEYPNCLSGCSQRPDHPKDLIDGMD